MMNQHKQILSEIKKRGSVSAHDESFVDWSKTIFTGKTGIKDRVRITLQIMYREGLIERYSDASNGSLSRHFVYHLKE
jgi:hypothetical protein